MKTKHATNAIGILCITALAVSILSGCSAQSAHSDGPAPEFFQSVYQKLPDGRTVLCLYKEGTVHGYSNGTTPTMSCDWAGAVVHP